MTPPQEYCIATARPEQIAPALALVALSWPPNERAEQVRIWQAALAGRASRDFILLVARRGEHICGAAFAQLLGGRAASIAPPQLAKGQPVEGNSESLAAALIQALDEQLAARQVRLAQCVLATYAGPLVERLLAAGFVHAADLLYLVSLADEFPEAAPSLPFELVQSQPNQPAEFDRLARLIEATYVGTLDCPQVDQMRDATDVLAGYQSIGQFDPRLWHIARTEGRDIGCLLLADQAADGQLELVYLGLIPEVRGRGWGTDLARQAQWLARRAGRERLFLAVDAANHPAIHMYSQCGLTLCDRRSVFVKRIADKADKAEG
jgi:ribosomal protein S18 acetylase RimI-like enzyme